MAVMTRNRPAMASPFPATAYRVGNSVRLDDLTGCLALVHVQGSNALGALAKAFGDVPRTSGAVIDNDAGLVVLLRPDIGVVLAVPGDVETVTGGIAGVRIPSEDSNGIRTGDSGEDLAVLDLSHGRGLMALSGPSAANVLSKLCGLDFSARRFPNLHAAQASLAKVRALIVRADEGIALRYILAVDRSHGAYAWGAIADAMREFSTASRVVSTT